MPLRRLLATTASLAILTSVAGIASAQDSEVIVADTRLPVVEIYGDRSAAQPGSVSSVGAETISDINADHPAEILNELPGVNIQMNSGQEHLIALRSPVLTGGAGQGSFLILENGVPTRAPAFGNVNSLFEIHHEVADAIEIVRGPGSAKYGSNAVHGLINVILDRPAPGDFFDARLTGSTLNRYRADLTGNLSNAAKVSLSLQDDTGWRDFTGVEQQKLSANYEFDLAGWNGLAWLSASNLNQETAGFLEGYKSYRDDDTATTNPNPEAYRDAQWAMGAVRLSREFGNGQITLTPFYRWQDMEFAQHFLPNGGFEENGHDGFGLTSKYEIRAFDPVTWRFGADIDVSSGWLRETQPEPFGFFPGDTRFPTGVHYDYTVDTTMLALWGEAEWEVRDGLIILAGLRGETHEYDYTTDVPAGTYGRFLVPDDREDSFDLLTPKLGMIWTPSGSTVSYYANYARGERAPQASDLYRLQSQQGVAEAGVETMDSIEIGARGSAFDGALVFDVAAYYAEKENFFFRDSDGLNVTDGSTRHQGIEGQANWILSDQFTVSATASLAEHTYTFDRIVGNGSEIIRSGNEVDTAPNWLGDLTLRWMPTERFEASVSAEYVGEYFTDPANQQTYSGHTLISLRVAYDLAEGLEGFVIVRNLFDLNYADRADYAFGNNRYFPGEPLNATFGIRKRFN
ncbi:MULTISPECIES: TonB-dependent receptor [Henriciella]|jgi:outer membrane receptor protein involved in Fe transport|uniref:TonB-dependent receptor n=1 Tax=Henriciella TaxID=453849 RepID=UPI003514EF70